ncbi:hypothetical protein BZ164_09450 [Pseudomonas veronii]|nr:hypothetical protein BZ164_09450 [Pseudomonas veronii]
MQWVVEYRREPATEDMPRKPVAGKARRRIGHWGVRYRTMMMSHLVNADGRQTSCRTVRRPKAGGKQSAQPGTGEGVRMEARRAKTWLALGQGLVHDSR